MSEEKQHDHDKRFNSLYLSKVLFRMAKRLVETFEESIESICGKYGDLDKRITALEKSNGCIAENIKVKIKEKANEIADQLKKDLIGEISDALQDVERDWSLDKNCQSIMTENQHDKYNC